MPVLIAIHVTLAISLFLPSILLPFALRLRGGQWREQQGSVSRALFWLQRNGTLVIGAGLAVTGVAMLTILGPQLLAQPWLFIALLIYATNIVLAFFVQRPALRGLIGMRPLTSDAERDRWKLWARRQRYVSYVMATLVGLIAFLMSTKPQF
ncbi:MAG TPA: hypothetical protein VMZ33_05205 [Candidatus Limnocylindrales bacterium]|nr:hypothetical protein [Candidatus Limnocylindrales bacterium]